MLKKKVNQINLNNLFWYVFWVNPTLASSPKVCIVLTQVMSYDFTRLMSIILDYISTDDVITNNSIFSQ